MAITDLDLYQARIAWRIWTAGIWSRNAASEESGCGNFRV